MSSLSAAGADGYYLDPQKFDPKKRGRNSYNAIAGSHPLGNRAKRLKSEGILVVRFEMPNAVWCLGCNAHIAQGVRFNADKKQNGMYFSTKIWEFEMKCPECPQKFVIRTNPKERWYDYVSGCRKKITEPSDSSETTFSNVTPVDRERLKQDPFYALEHEKEDLTNAERENKLISKLTSLSERRYGEGRLESNRIARSTLRSSLETERVMVAQGEMIGLAPGTALLPADEEDIVIEKYLDSQLSKKEVMVEPVRGLPGFSSSFAKTGPLMPELMTTSERSATEELKRNIDRINSQDVLLSKSVATPLYKESLASRDEETATQVKKRLSPPRKSTLSATSMSTRGRIQNSSSGQIGKSPYIDVTKSISKASITSLVNRGIQNIRNREEKLKQQVRSVRPDLK